MTQAHEATFGAAELQRALDCGELVRVYQPIVDVQTGGPRAVEALLRWNHPTDGQLTPNDFLLDAEAADLLVRIGWSVVIEAARRAADWRARFPENPITVSVNMADSHLAAHDVSSRVEHLLYENQVARPGGLALEFGEDVLLTTRRRDRDRLSALRNLGVDIVVDDFGAADAASDPSPEGLRHALLDRIASLGAWRLDVVKVDRRVTARLAAGADGDRGVAAVVDAAHAAGLQVVATAVETATDAVRARESGFDLAQGFFFSRPGPPDAIDVVLAAAPSGAPAPP